jgi:hypothetical protein
VTTARADVVSERFLAALAERDFEALGASFAVDARLRGLMPSNVRDCEGREEIVERFRIWNGDLESFELLESEVVPMEDLTRLRWRVRGVDPDDGPSVYEQTAYVGLDGERIVWMNLVCSGHRAVEE